ncbi:hypothetical protein ACFYWH_44390 [Streptomyces sp. NPDC003737]|uniref:hypothetical protein n=1 Tax=Streptomyces sp. NPDC003737 TaxID=3364685 RepID=UPI0036BE4195
MSEQDLSAYAAMWTTERDQWELHRFDDGYLPIMKSDPPMAEVICDDELADLVITRMLAAGVAVVDNSPELHFLPLHNFAPHTCPTIRGVAHEDPRLAEGSRVYLTSESGDDPTEQGADTHQGDKVPSGRVGYGDPGSPDL